MVQSHSQNTTSVVVENYTSQIVNDNFLEGFYDLFSHILITLYVWAKLTSYSFLPQCQTRCTVDTISNKRQYIGIHICISVQLFKSSRFDNFKIKLFACK